MRTQISKPEYALITVAVAQKLTGSQTATPTAKQLAQAQKQTQAAVLKAGVGVKGGTAKMDNLFNKARNELSGICGMGSDECGGLWDDLKAAVVKSAPAMPFIGPAAGLLMATAPIIASQNRKKRGQPTQAPADSQASQSAQASPDGQASRPAQAALPPQPAQSSQDDLEPSAQVVSGDDDLIFGESISTSYRDAEDALIFGEGGGSSELGAAMRRSGRSSRSFSGSDSTSMSPTAYRLAVLQRATKLSGGAKPKTKHMYVAQKSVDRDLSLGGISVRIPGAAPGRVTR